MVAGRFFRSWQRTNRERSSDGLRETEPLAVCFFSHSSDLAGAERTLLELVTQLIEDEGVRCAVVAPGDGPLISLFESVGARVIRTDYQWWCSTETVPDAEARSRIDESVARLRDEVLPKIADFDPDVICTQTIVIPYGALAASELARPHIWSIREHGEADGYRFFHPFDEVAGFIRRNSDFLFGASADLCPKLIPGLGRADYDVLYPAIAVPAKIGNLDAGFDFGGSVDFRVAEFATVAQIKRLDVAIEAIGDVTARGRSVGLVIVGPGEPAQVEVLERRIERLGMRNRVVLRGFIRDVFPVIASVDAVVISAPVHSFGRTAAESMLLAKPVVYPLGTGFDDYLENGVTGLGYEACNPHSMADRIDLLFRDRGLGREIGRRARTAAQKLFTRDGFGGKFYRRALALRNRHHCCPRQPL